jgi:hypothetical protein
MSRWRWLVWTPTVGLLVAGCGGPAPAPAAVNAPGPARPPAGGPPAAAKAGQKAVLPAVKPKAPEPGPPLPPLAYESRGRRDPFAPVRVAKEDRPSGLEWSGLKLVGVINGQHPLALVEATGGLGYIVKPGDSLGQGLVTDITSDSVTIAVGGQASRRESVTLKLAGN